MEKDKNKCVNKGPEFLGSIQLGRTGRIRFGTVQGWVLEKPNTDDTASPCPPTRLSGPLGVDRQRRLSLEAGLLVP